MDQINQHPSFDASFSYLFSSSLGLVDQEQQFSTTEQQPIYQGIPVQVQNPIPIYNCGPDIYQNEANHSNSLIQYNIESLTNFDSENASGTDIPEIAQSILNEYVSYQPNDESVKNTLLLTPGTPFQEQISWDELEIREQTTANHTSSGLQLTNLPAGIHSSQDLRPVAVVNPLCIHQTTSDNQTTRAEVNVEGGSSLAERKRERQRERKRELRKDPAYAARERERERERKRERYQTDSAYAKRQRERKRERYQTDPAYVERERERQRERYQADPAYAEGQKIYIKTYQRIKIQTSNKKEAKEQAVIARERYLQSVNSAKNSGDSPLTSNLAKATQSSSKNLEGAVPRFSVVKLKEYLQSRSIPLGLSERSAIEERDY
ncbi:hypothetical protein [Endozoicomonas sp. ALB115]|uniref:hypothetical protein n=1 Tax=Endozoicomonas sp. ALB115 TaxID=3403074 RepID=UPI003BB7FA0E